jgi:hypothetical protein
MIPLIHPVSLAPAVLTGSARSRVNQDWVPTITAGPEFRAGLRRPVFYSLANLSVSPPQDEAPATRGTRDDRRRSHSLCGPTATSHSFGDLGFLSLVDAA